MSENHAELQCTLTCEHLSSSGEITKRTIKRDAVLMAGRNQFGEIILQADVNAGKAPLRLNARNVVVYGKFVREGKATIKSASNQIQLMISNCPPHKLSDFLRMISIKMSGATNARLPTARQRLLSELPKSFTEISPLTVNDVEKADARRRVGGESVGGKEGVGGAVKKSDQGVTPTGKRKNVNHEEDKENLGSKKHCTLRRKLCSNDSATAQLSSSCESLNSIGSGKLSIKSFSITAEQQQVLSAVLSGRSLFFTGSAGTGKSHLLKRIIGSLPPEHTFVTASTGVAACHIGGTTLHAFSGIGSGTADLTRCVELASRPEVLRQWRQCRHLIIDEISMVDGKLFDKLEAVARHVRKCDKPFGGIQVIVCGDFLQLPPVTKPGEKRFYAFQSAGWRKTISCYMELKMVHRQSDKRFIEVLQNVRLGRCTEEMELLLRDTVRRGVASDGILATRLCTHKDDVDSINNSQLQLCDGESRCFKAVDSSPTSQLDALCPALSSLTLKVGAQVMLTKNIDVGRGLVNGARGVVVDFDARGGGLPRVRFMSGRVVLIQHERFSVRGTGGATLQRRQLPLKLAWAISIHKSQGMTLDCVEISLARVFEAGQAYVALSRAKGLEGLVVYDFDRRCIRADREVLQFYKNLHSPDNDL